MVPCFCLKAFPGARAGGAQSKSGDPFCCTSNAPLDPRSVHHDFCEFNCAGQCRTFDNATRGFSKASVAGWRFDFKEPNVEPGGRALHCVCARGCEMLAQPQEMKSLS